MNGKLVNFYRSLSIKDKIIFLFFLVISFFCFIFFVPAVQDTVIYIVEYLLHRQLRDYDKWHRVLSVSSLLVFLFAGSTIIGHFYPNKMDSFITSYGIYIVYIFCVFGTIAVLWLACISSDVWFDESHSLSVVYYKLSELIRMKHIVDGYHPPLYHYLLRGWSVLFGHSVMAAKIFSALPVIIAIWIGAVFLTNEFSVLSAFLFVALLLSSYDVIFYSHEIRMYSWAFLFVFLSSLFSFYIMKTKKIRWFVVFFLFAILAAYTHYFAAMCEGLLFVLIAGWLIYEDKDKYLKKILFVVLLGIALYLPWSSSLIRGIRAVLNGNFFLKTVSFKTVQNCFHALYNFKYGMVFFIASVLLFCKILVSAKQKGNKSIWVSFNFVLPYLLIFCTYIISLLIMPILTPKYIVPSIGLMLLFLAVAFCEVVKVKYFTQVLLLSFLFVVPNLSSLGSRETNYKIHYEDFLRKTGNLITEDSKLVFISKQSDHDFYVSAYYFPHNEFYIREPVPVSYFSEIYRTKCFSLEELPEKGDFIVFVIPDSEEYIEQSNFYSKVYISSYTEDLMYTCSSREEVKALQAFYAN